MNFVLIKAAVILCIVATHAQRRINMCDKKSITKWYKCKPRKVLVNIIPDTKETHTNLHIAAYTVSVRRCMGFDGQRQCVPAKSANVTVIVKEISTEQCREFLVEEHRKCKLEYPANSQVIVRNCKPDQRWNAAKSICECHRKCTTGSILDVKSCSCTQQ